jgi:hypothetical protein
MGPVFCTGDEGGILCVIDMGNVDRSAGSLASITHLMFDPRSPLTPQIAACQKRRQKGLRRTGSVGTNLGGHCYA